MTSIVAALGPTNTGKTHRAIERMLELDSGMIGLPLRLLAREVYDRVSTRVGEERVALITGEEKRVPKAPDYWVCTVEAMPVDVTVDFLAVDEIQLAAHHERGHVFTDRLLHARGRVETWFLGSDTMAPLMDQLVPTATHRRFHRLSRLRHAGRRSLRSLPPRSAVVAFSTDKVYELAERLRQLKGGVAVVLGALSPRTRNAQVAMYQAGEVQYLVATDAIGMGLNLDVDHVAFAALRKFDGREQRDLRSAELAQIAGRAGRHLNDGSFGTLRPLPELPPRLALAIEEHRFPAERRLVWRSSALDFDNVDALIASLVVAPRSPSLARVEAADDFHALKELTRDDEVRGAASTPEAVELLWQVCQIPDFRKLLLHRHVGLLKTVFLQLRRDGFLDDGWIEAQVQRVADLTGGIDALTARLAAVRTWTYVSQRAGWLRDPAMWQDRTRAIEDELGDALHERLVERFVERADRPHRRPRAASRTQRRSEPTGPFAALSKLAPSLDLDDREDTVERFVSRVVGADHDAFDVDRRGRVFFEGERVARLVRGKDLRTPMIALDDPDAYSAGERRQLERRLVALGRDVVREATGGFALPGGADAAVRGFGYVLEQNLGVVSRREARDQWSALDDDARERMRASGVREGRRFLFVDGALSPTALERRATLVALEEPDVPAAVPAEPLLPLRHFPAPGLARRLGYVPAGPSALRVDVLEELLAELAVADEMPPPLLDAVSIDAPTLSALGYARREGRLEARRKRRRRSKR